MKIINKGEIFSRNHPEKIKDEVFIGNFNDRGFSIIKHLSKRKGKIAYDKNGNRLNDEHFPVFISREDARKVGISDRF